MKRKRLCAALTAVACTAAMMSVMPMQGVQASALVQNDFEVTFGGWYAESAEYSAELTAAEGNGFDGSRALKIVGRTSPADGAVSEKDLYLTGGRRYDYSVRVFAEKDQHFKLSLLVEDIKTGEQTVKVLDEKNVKGGEWATLSASYKAPENSKSFKLTITTDTTDDFYFDDVTVTGKQELVASAADQGLKDMLVNYGIRSGNILNGSTINDSAIKNILLKDCNAIECENETKPDATLAWNGKGCTNTDIKVRDDGFAKIADWCATNGLGFRGHTLVWHSQTPEWFFKQNMEGNSGSYVDENTMNQRLESYIKNMFNLYKTKYPTLNLYAYDVCNECMNDSNGGPRNKGYNNGNSPWVSVYGDNHFIDKAFEYARKYAPANCHLFYNDYNEYAGFKRDAILTTAKRIKAAGNLDGVGMQSHINANANDGWSGENQYLTALKMYLQAGLEVQITELDISTDGGKYSLDQQANRYKNILKACIDWNSDTSHQSRVTLFQVWGPNDGHSWVGTDKATGRSNAPLLYTSNNQPKAAYTALTSLVPQPWGDGTKFPDTFEIKEPELDADGYWFHYTFENGTEGFSGRSATVESTSAEAYKGSKSLACTGRTATWNGAEMSLPSNIFKAGESYSFSAVVKYTSGGESEPFHFTISYNDGTETKYLKVDEGHEVAKDSWTQLANTSFTIPAGASDVKLYVETNDTEIDFYVDEVIGAPKGTAIDGPKGATVSNSKILGDVNCDGVISAADLSALKTALKSGTFISSSSKKNADVNSSLKVTDEDAKVLLEYLLTKITKFPVAEPEVTQLDFSQMEKAFSGANIATSTKKYNENNPCTTQRFGADPGWMVYEDRLYLYTTNDAFEYNGNQMKENSYNSGTINCISSEDLVNWTDHGAIPVAARNGRTTGGVAKWAANAWAPDALHKKINGKEKFFLYFANNGSGVGVLTSDSPTSGFVDPIGSELVSKSKVANMNDVVWMFDPGVYYDEKTDEAYLFMGGGVDGRDKANPKTGRCMKLGNDMISISGQANTLENPYLFEDSSLIKIGNLWYYSYCANWNVPGGCNINGVSFGSADILYMTNSNPMGPWTSSQLAGMVFQNTGTQRIDNGGNNHHSIVEFKGKYYLAYHCRQTEMRMGVNGGKGLNYRSTCIDPADYNLSTGKISAKGTHTGCTQLQKLNPFTTVQAETMANQGGIQIKGVGDTVVTDIQKGDWTMLKGVDFKDGCKTFSARASSKNGAVIKVCKANSSGGIGDAFAYIEVPAGGTMTDIAPVACNSIEGVNDIYFVFSGELEFDSWSFK